MAFTLTPAYSWSDGDLVTAVRLASTATPTLADGQTYTFGAGTAALPSWNFTGYTTTGLYAAAPGIGFTVAGASVGVWTTSGLSVAGALSATGLAQFRTTSGYAAYIGRSGSDDFLAFSGGVATNGSSILSLDSTALVYRPFIVDGSTVSIRQSGYNVGVFSSTGLAVTGDVTVSGAVKLGNAYQAGAPSSTGYITIKDSTGTTYKIPASV